MATGRVNRGRKHGIGRRLAVKVMVVGVVGLMSLAGTNPVMAASSQDGDSFWTQFTPSADTRLIFVSSSEGNDANNGLTPATPVKTLARAESLLRHGYPDWLLLKRGDVWAHGFPYWSKGGRSESEKMVIGAYGSDSTRPQIRPNAEDVALRSQGNGETNHIAFVGLHIEPVERADDQVGVGVQWYRRGRDIVFEDLYVGGWGVNFNLQKISDSAPVAGITINGCVVVDSWNKHGHSQGLFADRIDGLTIKNSVFASNGFNRNRGANPTIYNHNIYIQSSNKNVVIQNNIIADASSHGLQMRPGGIVSGNLFLSNPISILLGSNLPGTYPLEDGVVGVVEKNLIMYGRGIDTGTPRSWGVDVTNSREARVSDNILYMSEIGYNGEAIRVADGREYGVENVSVVRNYIVGWNGPVYIGGQGNARHPTTVDLRDNRVWRDLGANAGNHNFNKPFVTVFDAADSGLSIGENRYNYIGMHNKPFISGSMNLSISTWQSTAEPSAQFQQVSSLLDGLGIDSYLAHLGHPGTVEDFLAAARAMSKQNPLPSFRPAPVYQWVKSRLPE